MNIYTTIRETAEAHGGYRVAVRDGDYALTYDALFQRVDALAQELRQRGLSRFERVGIFCTDSSDYIIASLAVLSNRAVIVPVGPSSSAHEVTELLARIEVEWLLFEQSLCDRSGDRIGCKAFVDRQILLERCAGGPYEPGYETLNPAFIRFSSGTTGLSKGVLLSHEAIHERTDAANKGLQITAQDVVLWVLSMSYHFVVSILLFLRRGATIQLCNNDFPLGLLKAVERGDATFIYAAPFHYYTLCASGCFPPESLKGIRMAVSTSMKLQPDVAAGFAAHFGFELTEAYGIIEVGLPFINRSAATSRGSVGQILPDYEVQIRDPDDNGVGEVLIRGMGMYAAYVSPWSPRQPGEWFNTGDMGRFDTAMNLTIAGRKHSVINFMGMKVFPSEIEAVLNSHAAVTESMVFGKDHPRYGQLPVAKVVLAGEIDEKALRAHCLRELSAYKVPKEIEFVDALPRTPSGKIRRGPPHQADSFPPGIDRPG